MIANTNYVSSWKLKGLSAETIKPTTTSNNILTPSLSYYGTKTRVKFTGSCLKQPQTSYSHRKVVNIYIVYKLGASSSHNNDPTQKKLFFLAQLLWLKTQILISMVTLIKEFDLIEDQAFHFQAVDLVKM